jgi:DNA-binding response OmpR family regulator
MNKKILVVEDGVLTALHLKLFLERAHYEVPETVNNGKDLLDNFDAIQPDLILMDIMLKGQVTGIEAAKEIRKKSKVPMLFITALSDPGTKDEIEALESVDVVYKPFEEDTILQKMEQLLQTA